MLPRSSRWATVLLLGVPVVLLLVASGMESRWLLPPGLIVFVAVVIAVSWLPSDLVARRRRLTRITWIAGFSVACIVTVSATAISCVLLPSLRGPFQSRYWNRSRGRVVKARTRLA